MSLCGGRASMEQAQEEQEQQGLQDGPPRCSVSRLYGVAGGVTLVLVRVIGGLFNPIPDCDEVFN